MLDRDNKRKEESNRIIQKSSSIKMNENNKSNQSVVREIMNFLIKKVRYPLNKNSMI
ncbi:hypothetical protein [Virgibacillus ndiopensis]|uniref:hypothetical protein n=1 Tax=Virgibacillus ndiopensis TaxID=2004408 RepID=UPI00159BBDE9|nr:hypothetical protein [Virgibacillus ndiopensis]